MVESNAGVLRVLLVEDNPHDARLLMDAFREVTRSTRIQHCPDAGKAWKVLQDAMRAPAQRMPHAVLLDVKLPGTSGPELLERLRTVPVMDKLPVIMLTSSRHQADVERTRGANAAAYFVKPLTMDGYVALARELVELWMGGRLGTAA